MMMSIRIVLATDASSHSQAAIDMAGRIPIDAASLTVVGVAHVETPPAMGAHTWPVHSEAGQWYEREKEESMMAAKRRVDVAVEQLKRPGWHVDGVVYWGDPAEQILEVVRDTKADLLFVGSRGLGTVEGWLLGSVSQKLVSSVPCAIFIARPKPEGRATENDRRMRILLATDGSQDSDAAADMLGALGLGSESEIAVLNVVPSHMPPTIGFDLTPLSSVSREALKDGQEIAETVADTLRQEFGEATSMTRKGDPAGEIIEAAGEWDADVIALGSRGLGRIKAFLIGSVSQKVATYGPCSVLIVRNQMSPLSEGMEERAHHRVSGAT